jgi:hypothetical protein
MAAGKRVYRPKGMDNFKSTVRFESDRIAPVFAKANRETSFTSSGADVSHGFDKPLALFNSEKIG